MLSTRNCGRLLVSLASCLGALSLTASASAESGTHDGLYLSAHAGVGYVGSSGDANPTKLSGLSTPVALWAGYTFGIVAVGVGASLDTVWSPSYEYDSSFEPGSENDGFALFNGAVFADIYPDPKRGLHIMPSIGSGWLFAPVTGKGGAGILLGVGVGYDFWVASEFSLGVMGRMAYAPLKFSVVEARGNVTYSTFAPALLLTATYQ